MSWIDAIAAVQWVVRSRPSSAVLSDTLQTEVPRAADLAGRPCAVGSGGMTERTVMPPLPRGWIHGVCSAYSGHYYRYAV